MASINTGNQRPISEPLHGHACIHLDVTDETIDKMIATHIIEPCVQSGLQISWWTMKVVQLRRG